MQPTFSPKFSITFDLESAEMNYIILMKKHQGSLKQAFDANKDSLLGMGSEFRKISTVEQIFKHHPIWPRMKSILTNGSHWLLEPLDKDLQKADVNKAIEFGNHKDASNNPILLCELIKKDVR
jgi:hypothetical protein